MDAKLPKLIATSVVRGSQQGESHGGVFTVDFQTGQGAQHVDWNTDEIDWEGRGADRGLRGITFDGDEIYIAASDELFVYDRDFNIVRSHKNKYLKHCHEIHRVDRHIFLTSTGFDSLLSFNIESQKFDWVSTCRNPMVNGPDSPTIRSAMQARGPSTTSTSTRSSWTSMASI